jgi:hypothetical protein
MNLRLKLPPKPGGRAMKAARALGIFLATAAAVLAPAAAASASRATWISGATGWTCSYTNPEYMIHSGGATLAVSPGTDRFVVTRSRPGRLSDPYITVGYDVDLNSGMCNSRELPGSGGEHGRSYAVPVRLGRQGGIVTSVHDITSADFLGDTGFDIWFEPSTRDNSYTAMADQGPASTEIMIWLSHPGLGTQSSNPRYYPVSVDGHRWKVTVGLASDGHGRNSAHPNGWNVVNFIAPQVSNGSVSIRNLFLNPFFSYAIARGWLRSSDYLMAIDQGAEIAAGTMRVAGYTLTGLR